MIKICTLIKFKKKIPYKKSFICYQEQKQNKKDVILNIYIIKLKIII